VRTSQFAAFGTSAGVTIATIKVITVMDSGRRVIVLADM
jgi:hypothetical protein